MRVETGGRDLNCMDECMDKLKSEGLVFVSKCYTSLLCLGCVDLFRGEVVCQCHTLLQYQFQYYWYLPHIL